MNNTVILPEIVVDQGSIENTEHSADRINLLHLKFSEYGQNAKEWMRKCMLLLPEIDRFRVWKTKGFFSIYEYAAKLAGMTERTVNETLRIMRRIEDKPELKKIIEIKGINAIRPVATIATKDTAAFWAEKAATMTKHTLETYVKEFRINTLPGETLENKKIINQPALTGCTGKQTVEMLLDPDIAADLENLKGRDDWNKLMKKMIAVYKQEFEEQKPKAVEASSRHIPAAIKNHVVGRSGGICEFPECNKEYKILHHTDRFAITNRHDPDKIRALCEEHERIAHFGLIDNEQKPPNFWRIRRDADTSDPKYEIDQVVAKSRNRSIIWKDRKSNL